MKFVYRHMRNSGYPTAAATSDLFTRVLHEVINPLPHSINLTHLLAPVLFRSFSVSHYRNKISTNCLLTDEVISDKEKKTHPSHS